MIYVRLKGGVGNQLFQYAAGYALAKRTGQSLCFDTSFFASQTLRKPKLMNFNLDAFNTINENSLCSKIQFLKKKTVGRACKVLFANPSFNVKGFGTYLMESRNTFFDDVLQQDCKNVYLDGYFQSEKYFYEYSDDIHRQFSLISVAPEAYNTILKEIVCCNSVAVHVRRGDFVTKHAFSPRLKIRYVLDDSYYMRALAYMQQLLQAPIFYWFSDDLTWVQQNFGQADNYRFISLNCENADLYELSLMSQCQHIIAANSTFSWWAAWLNQQQSAVKIVPAKPFGCKDMIPDTWIKI